MMMSKFTVRLCLSPQQTHNKATTQSHRHHHLRTGHESNARDICGLAMTGVGTVDCAHHNMKRPNSIGDLQLGEKYDMILTHFDI